MENKFKEFKPTSWSIDNKTSIYILTIFITIFGWLSYESLPKENFPEVVFPKILVTTPYMGVSPSDMENLVTRPIEKELKSVSGVKKITSTSRQDFSIISVEFNVDENIPEAKQKVKDAVEKAKKELPNDLTEDPSVMDIDISAMPIMYINISGDYELEKLKKYADDLQDEIEELKEIRYVNVVGALEREIQVNVDMYKMAAAQITTDDIARAVQGENLNMSAGNVDMDGMKRSVRITGQFKSAEDLNRIIVKSANGSPIYLEDLAQIRDFHEEKESYSRLDGENALTLQVVKRGGQNLINASDKIKEILAESKKTKFPEGLEVTVIGDQSNKTRNTLNDLINSIIIGFILVTIILMFFMGATNAIFVGLSVPLSMFLAFMVMPTIDFNLNMIVLFAFLFALGIVVDDAIVVIENTHRVYNNGKVPIIKAAKQAAGEVFIPVLAGTLTTIAPFVPLAFWNSIIGKFMFYLPTTLIITLTASLIIAFIINPVFATAFMKPENPEEDSKLSYGERLRRSKFISLLFIGFAVLLYMSGFFGVGNFVVFLLLVILLYRLFVVDLVNKFQFGLIPRFKNSYAKLLDWILTGSRSGLLLLGTIGLLFGTVFLTKSFPPKVVFFPQGDPNFIYTYIKLPTGTDQKATDSITQIVEKKVYQVLGKNNPIVDAVISNVGIGAGDPTDEDQEFASNKGKVTVAFIELAEREGQSTVPYLDKIREAVQGIPGAEITVNKEQGGPPVGKPISIEISGADYTQLTATAKSVKRYIDSLEIPGIEELKLDVDNNKPEVIVSIDREKAQREGLSTGQAGRELAAAIFGREISKLKDDEDEYPIMLRFSMSQRNDVEKLLNTPITFRDMAMGGQIRQIPLSTVASVGYKNSFGGIRRKDDKRVITISSNVLTGFTPDEVNRNIQKELSYYDLPDGYSIDMTGEQEEQQEAGKFLIGALLTALGLIFIILVTQFNSWVKPLIILSEIIFSIIGVLLGFIITRMEMSVVMTGIGIVGLAGIVVKNGILILEFIDTGRAQGMSLREAIIEAGRTRLSPVLLTATSTTLGLIPLAIGFNIDFFTLFTDFKPNIYIGGESVVFWGPLSWTIIFGLIFATFLTLVLVPAMFYFLYNTRQKIRKMLGGDKSTGQDKKSSPVLKQETATEPVG